MYFLPGITGHLPQSSGAIRSTQRSRHGDRLIARIPKGRCSYRLPSRFDTEIRLYHREVLRMASRAVACHRHRGIPSLSVRANVADRYHIRSTENRPRRDTRPLTEATGCCRRTAGESLSGSLPTGCTGAELPGTGPACELSVARPPTNNLGSGEKSLWSLTFSSRYRPVFTAKDSVVLRGQALNSLVCTRCPGPRRCRGSRRAVRRE